MEDVLKAYTFQPLPDLGSLQRKPTSHTAIKHSLKTVKTSRPQLQRAFFDTLSRFIDSEDFVFAEAEPPYLWDPEAIELRVTRGDKTASGCLDDVRLEMMITASNMNPCPVVVVWDVHKYSECPPRTIIFGSHLENDTLYLDFLADPAIIHPSVLRGFASQVHARLAESDEPLMSVSPATSNLSNASNALDWLFDNSGKRPDSIAHELYSTLSNPPVLLTYVDLNSNSNSLAHWLVSQNLQVEDKVCLCSTRTSPYFYIAMAAILKAGGCYVSVDLELPEERKRFIMTDSQSKFVFVTSLEEQKLFGEKAILLTDEFMEEVSTTFGVENISRAGLDNLAYLLYTSGTTGNPKGCLLEHRGLFWAMQSFSDLPRPITNPDTDKRLALASTAFDVHISEIVQSWSLGSRLVSAPRFELLTSLRQHVQEMGITHIGMVPSMIEALLENAEGLPIKYLVSGGEKITDSLLAKWSDRPNLLLANFYGPTEVTIGCTSRRIGTNDRRENIGKPFPSCNAYVVDKEMQVVPIGCPGELIISGPLVARGYHNLPEATAKAFLEYPQGSGNRAYRTGDLVRMMPDTSLEIMGRIDQQVKYRGVRLETEGISSILHTAAASATGQQELEDEDKDLSVTTFITTHPNLSGQELLISVVAPATSSSKRSSVPKIRSATPSTLNLVRVLKKAVDEQLPPYMRPAYILPIDFIPLTLNGKTDKKKLEFVFRECDVKTLLEVQGGR